MNSFPHIKGSDEAPDFGSTFQGERLNTGRRVERAPSLEEVDSLPIAEPEAEKEVTVRQRRARA